jgi:hypothetical protein
MVKMSSKPGTSLTDVINSPHIYELEGQYIGTAKTNIIDGITSFLSNIEHLLTVFHGTRALLTNTSRRPTLSSLMTKPKGSGRPRGRRRRRTGQTGSQVAVRVRVARQRGVTGGEAGSS